MRMQTFVASVLLGAFVAVCALESRAADAPKAAETAMVTSDADYIIGPGDVLRIFVLQNPDLSTEVPVRPDGKITTPLVNDISAVGKSAATLSKEMQVALSEYVRSPTVNVIVTKSAGAFGQIRVVGQAANPRSLAYRKGMTVLDAVIEVGGLSQFAAGNGARLVRTENGKVNRIRLRLDDLINKGDVRQNVELHPGDIIFVPEARF